MTYNIIVIIGCVVFFILTTYGKCLFNRVFFGKSDKLDTTWTITTLYFFLMAYLLLTKHTIVDDGSVVKTGLYGLIFVVGFHITQRSLNSILDKVGKTKIKFKELEITHQIDAIIEKEIDDEQQNL